MACHNKACSSLSPSSLDWLLSSLVQSLRMAREPQPLRVVVQMREVLCNAASSTYSMIGRTCASVLTLLVSVLSIAPLSF